MSTMQRLGVYHSLEETLQILEANEYTSVPEVQLMLREFSKSRGSLQSQAAGDAKQHPFIVIEGLDGSGKTTVTKMLSNKLRGVKMSTPGPQFLALRPFFDKQPNQLRRAYYSISNYAAAFEIREKLKKQPVILDRFWHSTVSYALAAQIDDVSRLPEAGDPIYTWPRDLQLPDVAFFLEVSEAKRLERHRGRATTNTHEEIRLAQEAKFRAVVQEVYKRINPKITNVDADRYPKQVVKQMLEILSSKGIVSSE